MRLLKCTDSSNRLDSKQCYLKIHFISFFFFPERVFGIISQSQIIIPHLLGGCGFPIIIPHLVPLKHLVLLNVEETDTSIRHSLGQTYTIKETKTVLLLVKVSV